MIKIHLSSFRCDEETDDEIGADEPYALISTVALSPATVAGVAVPQTPLALDVTRHVFGELVTGGRAECGDFPAFWGVGNVPAVLGDPNDAIFIAGVVENDDGDPQVLRQVVKVAVTASVATTVALARSAKVNTLICDIGSALHIPTGVANLDDVRGPPQEVRFTSAELQRAEDGERVTSAPMAFHGDGATYTAEFQAVHVGWCPFKRVGGLGFSAPFGAPSALGMTRNGGVGLCAVVDSDGVPHLTWEEGDGTSARVGPWHAFERVAPYDARYPDGFTVPPGASLSMAEQSDGTFLMAVVDRDGTPQLSWEQPGGPWHMFERVAPDGSGDRLTVPGSPLALVADGHGILVVAVVDRNGTPQWSWQQPGAGWHPFVAVAADGSGDRLSAPGAALALAQQNDGTLALAVIDRNGTPMLSWQQPGAPWHPFVPVAADGSADRLCSPATPLAFGAQKDGTLVLAVADQGGVPRLSWQQPGAAWHSFVRLAPFDSRYPDGFTIPTGAWLTIVAQSDGMLLLVVVDRTGVPQLTWQRPGDSWHTFERVAARDPRFPDGFTVPPGAQVSAAQPSDGTTVLVAVGNDHLPYMSWRLDQP